MHTSKKCEAFYELTKPSLTLSLGSLPIRDADLTGYPLSPGKSLSLRMRSVAPVAWNLHPDNHPHTAGHLNWVTLFLMACFSMQQ